MRDHKVRTYASADDLAVTNQLAWKITEVAADAVAVEAEVTDMIINRMIDNAAVAVASLNRHPVVTA
ncbi:MAG: MmgE/PrpD family protein, partial [Rhodospirillaceae bacterium]|nr:MmgE/PrpD family protein [Rhodospirillaceae bacterium]